jgi:hypothetical protein
LSGIKAFRAAQRFAGERRLGLKNDLRVELYKKDQSGKEYTEHWFYLR